jgi:hypothetical protein
MPATVQTQNIVWSDFMPVINGENSNSYASYYNLNEYSLNNYDSVPIGNINNINIAYTNAVNSYNQKYSGENIQYNFKIENKKSLKKQKMEV